MMSEAKSKITHVVFDLDGLLLGMEREIYLYTLSPHTLTLPMLPSPDTEVLYTECTQTILDRYGLVFDWSVKSKMMGRPPLVAAQVLVDELKLPMTAEEFHGELYGTLMEKFPDARLMPGEQLVYLHVTS